MLGLRGRSCRDVLSADNLLTRRIRVQHPRPRRTWGAPLLVAYCCPAVATSAVVGCVPRRPSHSRKELTSTTAVGCQMIDKRPSVWGQLARALKRFKSALELLLRALGIGLIFSTPIVSGSIVYLLHRLPGFPSTQLCDWWWRMLLRAIDRSGTTFIKVNLYVCISEYVTDDVGLR